MNPGDPHLTTGPLLNTASNSGASAMMLASLRSSIVRTTNLPAGDFETLSRMPALTMGHSVARYSFDMTTRILVEDSAAKEATDMS